MAKSKAVSRTAALSILLAGSALMSACGGGGGATTAAASVDATTAAGTVSAQNLTLSGTPTTKVAAGRSYSFAPTVNQGANVSFTITNKPSWATFSTATGTLTGTPSTGDIGTFADIVITANTAAGSSSLPAFAIDVTQSSTAVGAATLSWAPPTENTDGSEVSDLAGYNIYYGTSKDALDKKIQITNPGLTAYTVAELGSGTYFFGISAFTASGAESEISVVGSKTIS